MNVAVCFHFSINDAPRKSVPLLFRRASGVTRFSSRQLYWQCFLPARQSRPAQNFPINLRRSISCANVCLARLIGVIPEWHFIHKAFFEIAVAAQTKFKDADAIANAIGCAPLPEILIQNFLIPWLEQGLRYAPAKTAMTEPNRIVSPSFNSASVTKSPLICVPFVEFKSFSDSEAPVL